MKYSIVLFVSLLFNIAANSQQPRVSVTTGTVVANATSIKYKATVKETFLPNIDTPAVSVITTSYEMENADTITRPVIFLFNGGPGASSSPLHMRAFGPVRLKKETDTTRQINNDYSLLDVADLVFIDPAGTGFTQIHDTAKAAAYWDVTGDAQAIIGIINVWKNEHHRTASPVFICGESYGTIRAGKMMGLAENFPVNGVILFSADLDMSLMAPISGNEMPYVTSLPSMAAIAWYHQKTSHVNRTVQQAFDEAIEFANNDYIKALFKGKQLPAAQRDQVAAKLAAITGLPVQAIIYRNLCITTDDFEILLLADESKRIGKLDGQAAVPVPKDNKPYSSRDDPSLVVNTDVKKDFVGKYFTNTLQFPATGLYRGINFDVNGRWQWSSMDAWLGYYSVVPDLEKAIKANAHLKLLVAGGMYDLATPLYATQFLLNQSEIPADRATLLEFPTGHSIFESEDQLARLAAAVRSFVLSASRN